MARRKRCRHEWKILGHYTSSDKAFFSTKTNHAVHKKCKHCGKETWEVWREPEYA
jgi:hypothetical protein